MIFGIYHKNATGILAYDGNTHKTDRYELFKICNVQLEMKSYVNV